MAIDLDTIDTVDSPSVDRWTAPQPTPAPPPPSPPPSEPDPFVGAIAIAAQEEPQITETTPTVTGLGLHIDGDFLAYYASGSDDTLSGQAKNNALDIIAALRARVGADTVIVHSTADVSDKGERFLIAQVKPYQGHRAGGRKPKNYPFLRDFLLNYTGAAFTSTVWGDREADDAMAEACYTAISGGVGYGAIATKDKDLRMVPGYHINWDSRAIIQVPPGAYDVVGEDGKQYGLKWFWLQMLMGDTADNCPGLEFYLKDNGSLARLGPKTAEKFLAGTTTSDEAAAIVIGLYQGCYQDTWADRFVEQAGLMWMRLGGSPAIDDFYTHAGHSRLMTAWPQEIADAVAAMQERVTLARQQIDALQS